MSTNVKHSLLVVRQASHLTNIHIPAVGQRPFLVRLVGSSQVPTSKRSLKNFKPNSKAFVCSPPSLNTAFHKDGSWLRTPKVREETDAFPSTHRREMGTLAVRQNCGLPKKHREGFVSPSEFDRGFCSTSSTATTTRLPKMKRFLPPLDVPDEDDVAKVGRFLFRPSRLPAFIISDLDKLLLTAHSKPLNFKRKNAICNLWKAAFHRMLVLFEPVLHSRPQDFHLGDPSYSRGKVRCYANDPRDAYTTMVIEFTQFTLRDEDNFGKLLREAEGVFEHNRFLGVETPIIIIFCFDDTFHFVYYDPNDTYKFRKGRLPPQNRPMVSQVPYWPPTIDNIRIVVECFYRFLIQSYIWTLDKNDRLEQGIPMEESEILKSLIEDVLTQTGRADILCDKGLDEQGDAMAEAAFYGLIRSCPGRPSTEYEERQVSFQNDEDLNHADLSVPNQLTIASRGAKPDESIRAQSTSSVA